MIRWLIVLMLVAVALELHGSASFAQNKNKGKSAQEQRDDQRIANEKKDVKQAQDKLKLDSKELQEAQKGLAEAEAKEKAARKKLDEVRERVKAKAEQSSGIDKALAAQSEAQKAYDVAAAPVLKALKETPAHQAAAKKVDEAKARLKQIREDKELSETVRRNETKQASQDALAATELEQRTLADSPAVKSARAKLAETQDQVSQIRQKIAAEIDKNPEIANSKNAMRSAAEASEVAGVKMKRIRDKLAADQTNLNREQLDVKKAEVLDKQNDAQDRANKTKNNKGKK